MSSLLKKRIDALETCLPDLELPPTTVRITVTDGRKSPPDPQPDYLGMVVVSGTHDQSGRVFHRGEDETEKQFKKRLVNNGIYETV